MTVVRDLFGWPGTWGTGGNMVAWVICGVIAFGWSNARQKARHVQQLAQAAAHHAEVLKQAAAHHQAALALAEKHHQQQLDRLDVHAAAIQAHVAATMKAAAGPVRAGAGSNPADVGLPADNGSVVPPAAAKRTGRRM